MNASWLTEWLCQGMMLWIWHTVDWWRNLWHRTRLVEIRTADTLPEGWKLWLQWKRARQTAGDGDPGLASDIAVLEADQGVYMGFIRLIAERVAITK